jgi:membrane protease YdiL (CAAX protease family)
MTAEPPLPGTPPPAPEPERVPFWGYADLFLLAGLAIPCMFLGWGIVRLVMWAAGLQATKPGAEAVPEMVLGYVLLALALMAIFRAQYNRPFWASLGWTRTRLPIIWIVILGFATGLLVDLVGQLIHTPPTNGPLVDMMKDRTTLILLTIFGTTAAPLFEELAFRGFLQPLLVRSLGAVAGIAIPAALFGALHYSEYGDSWRLVLLVALAGAGFGCMRHFTGSTRAAAIMHAAFNALSFIAVFGASTRAPH